MNLLSDGQRPQVAVAAKMQAKYAMGKQAGGPLLAALRGEPGADWAQAQANYVQTNVAAAPSPVDVTIESVDMGGVPGTLVTPPRVQSGRVLLYLHGGGYVSGGPAMYLPLAAQFAHLLDARVYLPDYRLAPEHPYPAPIADAFQAYRWLLASGCSPQALTLAGDSAGGALVVTIMVKAREAGLALPAAGVAISPWPNLENNSTTMYNRDGLDPFCTRESLTLMARTFLAGVLPTDPDASPVFADVRGLAPVLIQAGENEVMLADAMRLATHLGENRVRVSLEVWPGMPHVWHRFFDVLPEATEALQNAATFLTKAMAGFEVPK